MLALVLMTALLLNASGDWPEPRQNPHLTAVQPMAGSMREAPRILAQYDLGRSKPAITPVQSGSGESWGVSLIAGAIYCFNANGDTVWRSHPPGLNFDTLIAARDFNGDGQVELLLQAGRSMMPFGAAVLVSLEDGKVLWRYDVEPMSYAWYLHAGHYLHQTASEQFVVLMHGYPPDPKNGYMALFAFEEDGVPRQRWRYDFDQYTCFPTLLRADLDGDGRKELVVQTHSRMWFLDAETGAVKHFAQWDVSPANVRSYGLVRFVDLNGDGREDFLCIADFAQHHEVLLNRDGRMEKAWHHGWEESVTTGKVATVYTDPPYADIDGDGTLEVVVSMFNSEGKPEWLLRVYDAVTGKLKYRVPGVVAEALVDLDGDGTAEVLANRTSDPPRSSLDGALLLQYTRPADGETPLRVIWEDAALTGLPVRQDRTVIVRKGTERFALGMEGGAVRLEPWRRPDPAPEVDFAAVPPLLGPPLPQLLAADLLPARGNEVVLYTGGEARIFALEGNVLTPQGNYASSCLPAIGDFNGDGRLDLALSTVDPAAEPVVRVVCPSQQDREVWCTQLPPPERAGLPQPRLAYLRTGHFTGRETPDLYLWAGTPVARSLVLRGSDGGVVWEKGAVPNSERYWGASVNLASVYDFNDDGKDDLVFTNPDYYCVADGPTGELLLGPAFPPEIFAQPSQGLYTVPALLAKAGERPLVALTSGHYFQGMMTLDASPRWHKVPAPGEARTGAEGFLLAEDGQWLMGYGRQDGHFVCVAVEDGGSRGELDMGATISDIVTADVDADGAQEFLFGTSHGELVALQPAAEGLRVVWRYQGEAGLGTPLVADLDGDGEIEIVVGDIRGRVWVLR